MLTTCPSTRFAQLHPRGVTEVADVDMRSGTYRLEAAHSIQKRTDSLLARDWLVIKEAL